MLKFCLWDFYDLPMILYLEATDTKMWYLINYATALKMPGEKDVRWKTIGLSIKSMSVRLPYSSDRDPTKFGFLFPKLKFERITTDI